MEDALDSIPATASRLPTGSNHRSMATHPNRTSSTQIVTPPDDDNDSSGPENVREETRKWFRRGPWASLRALPHRGLQVGDEGATCKWRRCGKSPWKPEGRSPQGTVVVPLLALARTRVCLRHPFLVAFRLTQEVSSQKSRSSKLISRSKEHNL